MLSGVLDPSEVAGGPGYREHGGPVPVPFSSPPPRAIPGWAVVLFGLVTMGVSVLVYVVESEGVLSLVGGLAGGLVVAALGLAIRRGQRASRLER